jgi:L-malate glycosyltransferase
MTVAEKMRADRDPRRMRILHILSNWKWTKRSEPVVDLALAQQALGAEAILACGRWPGPPAPEDDEYSAEIEARKKGVEPVVLRMGKHFSLSSSFRDVPELRSLIADRAIDVVHVHMLNAHLQAALACRGLRRRPRIVLSSYEPDGPPPGWRSRWLIGKRTSGLVTISAQAARTASARFGLPPEAIEVIEPGIDLKRFRPGAKADARRGFGLDAGHWVVGMVTRFRADRRIDIVLRAVQQLAARRSEVRLLLAGQGEDEAAIRQLIRDLGIEDRVAMPGYCRDERLVEAYAAMDVLAYPAPGTDKSARAIREAMACGVPVVAERRGFAADLIGDRKTGRFAETAPLALLGVLDELANDPGALARMGAAAAREAAARFSADDQARRALTFYRRLARVPGPPDHAATEAC